MKSGNIREVQVIEVIAPADLRPGDTGILREIAGTNDYLTERLIELSSDITRILMDARKKYFQSGSDDVRIRGDEQIYTSMLSGKMYVVI